MAVPIEKLAALGRIVATGQITGKGAIYDLIAALRKVDAKLPPRWPVMLHLEDFVAPEQFGGEYELSAELLRIKKRRELFAHVQDYCVGTAPLVALLYCDQRTANKRQPSAGLAMSAYSSIPAGRLRKRVYKSE